MLNIQPGKGKKTRLTPSPAARSGNGIGSKIASVFKVAFFIAVVAGISNCYIYLNQKIVETDRKIAAGNKEIHKIERELEGLRIRREKFRAWPHISKMMTVFRLNLRVPQSGQVCKLNVLTPEQAAMVPLASPPALHQAAAERPQLQQTEVRRSAQQPRQKERTRRPVRQNTRRNTANTRNGDPLFEAR